MTPERDVIEALKQRQADLGLSDHRFAVMMGVDRETWRKLKVGITASPTVKLLRGAGSAFPDLAPVFLAFFMTSGASNHSRQRGKAR